MRQTLIDYDLSTLPTSLLPYVQQATIYDSSSSPEARTLFIDGKQPSFLKIAAATTLEREYRMTSFLQEHGLAPEAILYTTHNHQDYLLTAAVPGKDGVDDEYIQQPARLATALGKHLRRLHSLPLDGCPYPNRSPEIRQEASAEMQMELTQANLYQPVDHVVIHGDYCLPNVMMKDLALSGFIDNGGGGIGDRHYDLAWGLWSLQFNLDTDQYQDDFLNGYGRADIHMNGILYFRKIIDSMEF